MYVIFFEWALCSQVVCNLSELHCLFENEKSTQKVLKENQYMVYEMIQFSSFVPIGMNRDYVSKAQTPYLTKNIKKLTNWHLDP